MPITTSTALLIGAAVSAAGTVATTLMSSSPSVNIPKAEVPAVAASGARADTGAQVKLGVTDVKDARISGVKSTAPRTQTIDPLGGLGRGGLAV